MEGDKAEPGEGVGRGGGEVEDKEEGRKGRCTCRV